MRKRKPQYDEGYVQELLAALPKGISFNAFYQHCKPDINAGYINEVQEAYWRYFAAPGALPSEDAAHSAGGEPGASAGKSE